VTHFPLGTGLTNGLEGNDLNTIALLHFDDQPDLSPFVDENGANISRTWSGNTQLNTSSFIFGNASLAFASGRTLQTSAATLQLGSGDFTIEFYFKTSEHTVNGGPIAIGYNYIDSTSTVLPWLTFGTVSDTTVQTIPTRWHGRAILGSRSIVTAGIIADGIWRHIAMVRQGANFRLFLNGSSQGTVAAINSPSLRQVVLNADGAFPGTSYTNGGMDELRISNVARYWDNFTPQTHPFS